MRKLGRLVIRRWREQGPWQSWALFDCHGCYVHIAVVLTEFGQVVNRHRGTSNLRGSMAPPLPSFANSLVARLMHKAIFACLDVRLASRIDTQDRAGHGSGDFPAEEFLPDVPDVFHVDSHDRMAFSL